MTELTKKCSKCGEEKPATLEYFYKHYNYLRPDCKVCSVKRHEARYEANKEAIIERSKAYYEANKEAIAEYHKVHYEANKEVILERKKVHYEANKEAILERDKDYREANKEAIAEKGKAYYEANKEAIDERSKARYSTPAGKYTSIKSHGIRRGKHFDLPYEFYESQLWGKPCHYCGCEIEVTGLDRKDNDKGYTPDNVVPCCWGCNTKKHTKPYEQYLAEVRDENNT